MAYSKRRVGTELILMLENNFDPQKIAAWANKVHSESSYSMDTELNEIVQNIASMSLGEQFMYTKQELEDLAIKLIKSKN
jgi:hypothetical protein